jgi:hypothetical protein
VGRVHGMGINSVHVGRVHGMGINSVHVGKTVQQVAMLHEIIQLVHAVWIRGTQIFKKI